MKKMKIMITAALAAMILIGAGVRAADLQGTISEVKGDVKVKATATADWKAAADGMKLGKDASIKTGPDSEALFNWGGNAVHVFPLSIMKVDKLTKETSGASVSTLSLESGRVMAKAGKLATTDSAFSVKTPTAVAGVRGTGFDCELSAAGLMTVAVVDGNVVLSVGEIEVTIPPGLMSQVELGGVPGDPIAIPPERLTELRAVQAKLNAAIDKAEREESKQQSKDEKKDEKEEKSSDSSNSAMDGVLDQAVNDTIQNDITNTVDYLQSLEGCPAGGGCLDGDINLYFYNE